MKKQILFIMGLVCIVQYAGAQALSDIKPFNSSFHPVHWHYHVKKITAHDYELHIMATIQPGWHLYAQNQPEDAIAVPTVIKFEADSSSVMFDGKTKEIGRVEKFENKELGISALQYSDSVDFVQAVKSKNKGPVNISSSITYQACREEECLQPVTITFSLLLNK